MEHCGWAGLFCLTLIQTEWDEKSRSPHITFTLPGIDANYIQILGLQQMNPTRRIVQGSKCEASHFKAPTFHNNYRLSVGRATQ